MDKSMYSETEFIAIPLCLEQIHIGFLEKELVLGLWGNGCVESFLFSSEGAATNLSLDEWFQPLYKIVLPSAFTIQHIRIEFGSCSFEQHSFIESWSVLEAWDGDKAVLAQMAWHDGSFVSLDAGILRDGTVEPVHTFTRANALEVLCI
jgi:hypothetical protein